MKWNTAILYLRKTEMIFTPNHEVVVVLQLTLNNAEASSENIQTLKNSIESELPKILSSDSKNTDEKLDVSCTTTCTYFLVV